MAQQCIEVLTKTDTPFTDVLPKSIGNFRVHLLNECMKVNLQMQTKVIKDNPGFVRVRLAHK